MRQERAATTTAGRRFAFQKLRIPTQLEFPGQQPFRLETALNGDWKASISSVSLIGNECFRPVTSAFARRQSGPRGPCRAAAPPQAFPLLEPSRDMRGALQAADFAHQIAEKLAARAAPVTGADPGLAPSIAVAPPASRGEEPKKAERSGRFPLTGPAINLSRSYLLLITLHPTRLGLLPYQTER